uniref:Uncharacterized protein n=1 Tax=Daphnia magna TaxID=35525 RepID=A0A0P6BQN1_9CRUS
MSIYRIRAYNFGVQRCFARLRLRRVMTCLAKKHNLLSQSSVPSFDGVTSSEQQQTNGEKKIIKRLFHVLLLLFCWLIFPS